eukprot:8472721-Pyramimonas_sp.AAC.1
MTTMVSLLITFGHAQMAPHRRGGAPAGRLRQPPRRHRRLLPAAPCGGRVQQPGARGELVGARAVRSVPSCRRQGPHDLRDGAAHPQGSSRHGRDRRRPAAPWRLVAGGDVLPAVPEPAQPGVARVPHPGCHPAGVRLAGAVAAAQPAARRAPAGAHPVGGACRGCL